MLRCLPDAALIQAIRLEQSRNTFAWTQPQVTYRYRLPLSLTTRNDAPQVERIAGDNWETTMIEQLASSTTHQTANKGALLHAIVFVTVMLAITLNNSIAQANGFAPTQYRAMVAYDEFSGSRQYVATFNTRPPRRLRARNLELAIDLLSSAACSPGTAAISDGVGNFADHWASPGPAYRAFKLTITQFEDGILHFQDDKHRAKSRRETVTEGHTFLATP